MTMALAKRVEGALMEKPKKYVFHNPKRTIDSTNSYRENVIKIMRADGASETFIAETVTDSVISTAMKNKFAAESLAWALMQ